MDGNVILIGRCCNWPNQTDVPIHCQNSTDCPRQASSRHWILKDQRRKRSFCHCWWVFFFFKQLRFPKNSLNCLVFQVRTAVPECLIFAILTTQQSCSRIRTSRSCRDYRGTSRNTTSLPCSPRIVRKWRSWTSACPVISSLASAITLHPWTESRGLLTVPTTSALPETTRKPWSGTCSMLRDQSTILFWPTLLVERFVDHSTSFQSWF